MMDYLFAICGRECCGTSADFIVLIPLGERVGMLRADPPHFRCRSSCTRLSERTRSTIRVAIAAASPKFKIENPTW
jgi:hypothetical protein